MTADGTALYLQVEQALKDFQKGVTRLKAQQAETETLLSNGNEALENLVRQVAHTEKMQSQVESDLRLLERFRESQAEENSRFCSQIEAEQNRQKQIAEKNLADVRTDLSVRRQELLGLIGDLKQNVEGRLRQIDTGMDKLKAAVLKELAAEVQYLEEICASRQRLLERKLHFLSWGFAVLAALLLASLLW
jgi:septation ring formation regulator EzrA